MEEQHHLKQVQTFDARGQDFSNVDILESRGSFLSRITHRHITDALLEAYRSSSAKKSEIIETLQKKPLFSQIKLESEDVRTILEIAVSIGLMVKMCILTGRSWRWKPEQTLNEFVQKMFPKSPPQPKERSLEDLNWKSMFKYANIVLVPTRELDKHLTLGTLPSGARYLYIFNMFDCMKAHEMIKYCQSDVERDQTPIGFTSKR